MTSALDPATRERLEARATHGPWTSVRNDDLRAALSALDAQAERIAEMERELHQLDTERAGWKRWTLRAEEELGVARKATIEDCVTAIRALAPAAPATEYCQCGACSPTVTHASDCAVHNEYAARNGPCDCGAEPATEGEVRHVDDINDAVLQGIEQDRLDGRCWSCGRLVPEHAAYCIERAAQPPRQDAKGDDGHE